MVVINKTCSIISSSHKASRIQWPHITMVRSRLRATKLTFWVFSFEAMLLLSTYSQSGKQKGTQGVRPPSSQTPPSGLGESRWRPWERSREVGEQTDCSRVGKVLVCTQNTWGAPERQRHLNTHSYQAGPGFRKFDTAMGSGDLTTVTVRMTMHCLRWLLIQLTNTVMVNYKENYLHSGSTDGF